MTNHNHSDGIRPDIDTIRKRLAADEYDHTVRPTIEAVLESSDHWQMRANLLEQRLHSLHTFTACTLPVVVDHQHTPETDATGHRVCGECRLSLEDS